MHTKLSAQRAASPRGMLEKAPTQRLSGRQRRVIMVIQRPQHHLQHALATTIAVQPLLSGQELRCWEALGISVRPQRAWKNDQPTSSLNRAQLLRARAASRQVLSTEHSFFVLELPGFNCRTYPTTHSSELLHSARVKHSLPCTPTPSIVHLSSTLLKMLEMEAALKTYFGFSVLRPYQKEVVCNVLKGNDGVVIMATGSGKSICYQLPHLICKKTAIVISPLLSLMQDQVMSLIEKGIKADYLGSSQTNPGVTKDAKEGKISLLYMTPEKALSLNQSFWMALLSKGICLVAVDEAHCISEWGHDFRMEYKKLHILQPMLPGVPFLALTATATTRVREDIRTSLSLHTPYVHVGSFDRPNLYYGAKCCDSSKDFINELFLENTQMRSTGDSTIVYCATIRDAEDVHKILSAQGFKTALYHGRMGPKERTDAHISFITDEVNVIVATVAFGMGIDKPDVRCVVHYGCPKSLEFYYQESGRCGRDGLPSTCLLYYKKSDFTRGTFYCNEVKSEAQKACIMESFFASQKYCMLATCRRQNLLMYFGQQAGPDCGNCDNCCCGDAVEKDVSIDALYYFLALKIWVVYLV